MKSKSLIQSFNQALNWNIFLYIFYKICFVIISYSLYQRLPAEYFSQWALGNACVFLSVLWIDPGFKKSIPRFYPIFCQNKSSHSFFIKLVIALQSCFLIAALLPYWYAMRYIGIAPCIQIHLVMLLITETITNLFQNIYHAHFKNRFFNSVLISGSLIEMAINTYFIFSYTNYEYIVQTLFLTKILSSISVTIITFIALPKLLKTPLIQVPHFKQPNTLIKQFFKHSFFMWGSNFIKSLTERNFLFPYFTKVYGLHEANLFKISNDGAIFFQRTALKSIGSTDTALLSYAQLEQEHKKQSFNLALKQIFNVIKYTTIFLVIASIGVVMVKIANTTLTGIFILLFITTNSIIEIFLSPYERYLEVKYCYKKLYLAYLPYCLGIVILAAGTYFHIISCNMITSLVIIHVLRISSSLFLAWQAKTYMQNSA